MIRHDKLNSHHYAKFVVVNTKGDPINPISKEFRQIDDQFVKDHTEYFLRQKLKPSNTPFKKIKKKYSKSI